jgi:NAD+ diphosphatase
MLTYTHFKFCPHCGKPSLKVLEENGAECSACGFVYYHNMAAGVAGIIEVEPRKFIIIRRAHEPGIGMYDLPGGFVDYRESIEEALVREIREELNLELRDIRYFGSAPNTYRYKGVTYFSSDAFFLCKPVDLSTIRLSEENSEYRIADAASFDLEIMAFESMRRILGKYRKFIRGV